jgi:inorganic phosphate transporter, PiT family
MMGKIILSWFISPAFGALLGFLMFILVRRMILDQEDPQGAALRRIPYLFFIVFSTLVFALLIVKGMKGALPANLGRDDITKSAVIAAVIGAPLAAGCTRWVRRRARGRDRSEPYVFVEGIFVYLQILTACYVALAHGANDVANAVGPLAAIAHIVKVGTVEMKVVMPGGSWRSAGMGIVLGLATYGYRVMLTVGTKIVEMSPSRGFAAEFGAATTVLICSLQGLPISTTHTLVGAVVGWGSPRHGGAELPGIVWDCGVVVDNGSCGGDDVDDNICDHQGPVHEPSGASGHACRGRTDNG